VSVGAGEEVGLRVWDRARRRELTEFRCRRIAGAWRVCARELVRDRAPRLRPRVHLGAPGVTSGRDDLIAFVLARFVPPRLESA